MFRRTLLLTVVLVAAVLPAAAAAQPTVVSITFDAATTQQLEALDALAARGLHATLFANALRVGTPGRLSWSELRRLQAQGHEVGGSTATDAWLPGLTPDQARHEVCDDRAMLLDQGLAARSFAYPFRDSTPALEQVVQACGYASGRGGGGFSHDLLPPRNPYATITPAPVTAGTTLQQLQAQVLETQADGGGWTTFQMQAPPAALPGFADWLAARRSAGSLDVRTVGEAIGGALQPAVRLPRGETVVSFTFDDGTADQWQAKALLEARGMRATFYANSGTVGAAGFLSWSQLLALQTAGHEVGGHTRTHPGDLSALPDDQRRREVCDDRAALLAHGILAATFAYPHATFDAPTQDVVRLCGYGTARTVGGLQCPACAFAETTPSQDGLAVRSADEVLSGTTLADLQRAVTTAEALGGGWVPLVFHGLGPGQGTYGYPLATFTAFLDWLAARRSSGTSVRTVRAVTGVATAPSPDRTAPQVRLTAPGIAPAGRSLSVQASASDAGGAGVASVALRIDGRLVGDDAAAPFSWSFKPTKTERGLVTLTATATDAAGNAASASTLVLLL